jgi:hypothetical protein
MAITLPRHFTLEYDYFMPGYWGQWRGYEVTIYLPVAISKWNVMTLKNRFQFI